MELGLLKADYLEDHSEDLTDLGLLMEGRLGGHLEDLMDLEILMEGRLEDLMDPEILMEDRLEDLMDPELLMEGRLEDPMDLELQRMIFLNLKNLRFHPSLRMPHRASSQVLPLRPVLGLVLQMFSWRPWSSLTTPYLAA